MGPDGALETREDSPAEATYRELVAEHADRLYGVAVLLVGDPRTAQQVLVEGFRRTWDGLRRGRMVGDADETLYWSTTRAALGRLSRSRDMRGLLPATTADDRQITAFGITSGFSPQQQAAIYLAVWAGVGYRLAGLASGAGEGRARDLAFSARQEYREARGAPPDETGLCHEAAPALSSRADGETPSAGVGVEDHLTTCGVCPQTSAIYEEFTSVLRGLRIPSATESPVDAALGMLRTRPEQERRGLRRILQLIGGPLILTVVLIGGLFVFRACEEPTIATGVGRTSDLVYVMDDASAIVILDSGSGRELARLPNGTLAASGQRVYSVAHTCLEGGGCTSTIRVTDAATMASSGVGRLDGQLYLLGADEPRGQLYLTDLEGSRLIAFDSSLGEVTRILDAPANLLGVFGPQGAVFLPAGPTLYTLAATGGETAAVVVDLTEMNVVSTIRLPGPREQYIDLLPVPTRSRLYAYQASVGMLHEVDLAAGQLIGSATLGSGRVYAQDTGGSMASGPGGSVLYVVAPGDGIALVHPDPLRVNRIARDHQYRAVVVGTDGRLLYVVEQDGSYAVLDATTGQQLRHRSNVGAATVLQANAGE